MFYSECFALKFFRRVSKLNASLDLYPFISTCEQWAISSLSGGEVKPCGTVGLPDDMKPETMHAIFIKECSALAGASDVDLGDEFFTGEAETALERDSILTPGHGFKIAADALIQISHVLVRSFFTWAAIPSGPEYGLGGLIC